MSFCQHGYCLVAWVGLVQAACNEEATTSDALPDAAVLTPRGQEVQVPPPVSECDPGPVLQPGLYASGGSASGVGQGGPAGDIHLIAGGDILHTIIDADVSPSEVEMPQGGVELSAGDLGADIDRVDTLRVRGFIQASGDEMVRTIRSTEGDIIIEGRLLAAAVSGGPTQSLHLEAPSGTIYVVGTIDSSAAVGPAGSAGGDIELDAQHVVIDGAMVRSTGGSACDGLGGPGGAISITARDGAILIRRSVVASSGATPRYDGDGGAAGSITLSADGAIEIDGAVIARGGHGGEAQGGPGAMFFADIVGLAGSIRVAGGFLLDVSGGSATAGPAGPGGDVEMRTIDGNVTIAGQVRARGGEATGSSSRGGQGGGVYVWTDKNADGIGGDLTVSASGLIDTSGGDGEKAGSGRNNGSYGTANFPDEKDQISVLLNSETVPGPPADGRLANLGVIISRGGATDGWGGDVIFHGRRPAGEEDPEPGQLLLEGHGTGEDGDSAME